MFNFGENPEYMRNRRDNLAEDIERYWVGNPDSNVGIQYLKLEDGLVKLGGYIERTDIYCLQDLEQGINVFVSSTGEYSAQLWQVADTFAPLSEQQDRYIRNYIKRLFRRDAEFVEDQRRFFREQPWLLVDGMTPEQAVHTLREWKAGEPVYHWANTLTRSEVDALEKVIVAGLATCEDEDAITLASNTWNTIMRDAGRF